MRARHLFASFSVASLLLSGCEKKEEGETHEFTASDEAAIRAINDSALSYIRQGNWTKWASLSAENGVMQPPNGKTITGHAAMEAFGKSFPPVESVEVFNMKIVGSGDLAYLTSGFVMRMKGVPVDTSKQLVVFHRDSDGWKAHALSFSSDRPVSAPAPPNTSTKTKRAG